MTRYRLEFNEETRALRFSPHQAIELMPAENADGWVTIVNKLLPDERALLEILAKHKRPKDKREMGNLYGELHDMVIRIAFAEPTEEDGLIIETLKGTMPILWRKRGSKTSDPCPFCGKPHKHGSDEGYRLTHCMLKMRYGKEVEPPLSVRLAGKEFFRKNGYYLKEY